MRIALQEDLIQQLQDELVIVQGKVCCCHECPVTGGCLLAHLSDPAKEKEEGLEYASKCSYMTPPTAPLELEDIIAQDMLRFSTPPIKEQEGVRECCQTRVVEYLDDLVDIVDDKRSRSLSSSELSSSPGTSLPGLEDQENINPIPIPPPVGNLPPYAVSGQQAVQSKGVPKSAFHPYCRPLAQLQCSKTSAGRLHGGDPWWRTTLPSSSPASRGYGVVHSGTIGQCECGSSGGRGSGSSSSSGGGDVDSTQEEGSESSVNPISRTQERNLRQRIVLRKCYEEATAHVEYLQSIDCFSWGPGITE